MKKNSEKNRVGNKDIVAEIKEEFKRHTNILLEKMDTTVKTVTEQYGNLTKQVSGVKNDVEELKNDMAIIKPAVEANSKDIQELKKDVKEIKSELHSMNMALMETGHETKDHEKRIKKLEEKVLI